MCSDLGTAVFSLSVFVQIFIACMDPFWSNIVSVLVNIVIYMVNMFYKLVFQYVICYIIWSFKVSSGFDICFICTVLKWSRYDC